MPCRISSVLLREAGRLAVERGAPPSTCRLASRLLREHTVGMVHHVWPKVAQEGYSGTGTTVSAPFPALLAVGCVWRSCFEETLKWGFGEARRLPTLHLDAPEAGWRGVDMVNFTRRQLATREYPPATLGKCTARGSPYEQALLSHQRGECTEHLSCKSGSQ